MRKITVHLNVWFNDMAAESTDDAMDAIRQALVAMQDKYQAELADALQAVGASDVKVSMVAW